MAQRIAVLGYRRVSTKDQAEEGVSLDVQLEKQTAYCSLYDIDLIGVETDEGRSGKSMHNRPGLQRLLERLRAGEAQGVLVSRLDRLTRSVRDLGTLVDGYFVDGRYQFLSVQENIDTRAAHGRLVLNILVSVSQWEREAIGERTGVAMKHLRALGVTTGQLPYGLAYQGPDQLDEEGRQLIAEVTAAVQAVALIRYLHSEGKSLGEIAKVLMAQKVAPPQKRSDQWHRKSVRDILRRCGLPTGGNGRGQRRPPPPPAIPPVEQLTLLG